MRRVSPRLLAPRARVEDVPEAVAQEVEAEDGQHDGQPGKYSPGRRQLQVRRPSLSIAPHEGAGGLGAQAQKEREASVRMARRGAPRPGPPGHRRTLGRTWRTMIRGLPAPRARAASTRSLPAGDQDRPPHHPGEERDVHHGDGQHGVVQAGPQHGHDGDGQHHGREGEQDVHDPHAEAGRLRPRSRDQPQAAPGQDGRPSADGHSAGRAGPRGSVRLRTSRPKRSVPSRCVASWPGQTPPASHLGGLGGGDQPGQERPPRPAATTRRARARASGGSGGPGRSTPLSQADPGVEPGVQHVHQQV